MIKVDLRKELRGLYQPPAGEVVVVDVPTMSFLASDGEGDPNTAQAYADAVEALFAVSYALKFAVKKGGLAIDYGVMPLEALWWADDLAAYALGRRSDWKWRVMIMQPDFVTRELVEGTIAEVARKKKLAALRRLRFESFAEGKAAQVMHVGPFSEEGPTIRRVHDFIERQGSRPVGRHHEIYLSDIRKAEPSKWRTVVRQPME